MYVHVKRIEEKSMTKLQNDVAKIITYLGGRENIISATHCVTRLRLILKDKAKVRTKALEAVNLVQGTFYASGQFQVVIGPGVEKVYNEFIDQTGLKDESVQEVKEKAANNGGWLQKGIRILADIFIPIIPAIVAAGLLMGINNLIVNKGIFYAHASVLTMHPEWTGFSNFINLVANAAFTFLPVLISWSAAKKFGGSPVLGIVLGLILVHPDLMSAYTYAADPSKVAYWNIGFLHVAKVGYQGQVLPVLFAAWILSKCEIQLKKIIPNALKLVLVAPIALLVTAGITFTIIGPLTMAGANGITNGVVWLFKVAPIFAGAFYAFICPILVVTGMHHLFLGVNLQMAGSLGYVTLWPIGDTVTMSQAVACLTTYFFLKNKKIKNVALTSALSASLGITEPAIYGINLRYRFPFVAVMCASACGSAFLAYFNVKATSVGVSGLFSILSVFPRYWGIYAMGELITIVMTILLTYAFHKGNLFKVKQGEELNVNMNF
jgi:PTS system trehalose-specific IIC component